MPRQPINRPSSHSNSISGKENEETSIPPGSPCNNSRYTRRSRNRSTSTVSPVSVTPPLSSCAPRRQSPSFSSHEINFGSHPRPTSRSSNTRTGRRRSVSTIPLQSPQALSNTVTFTLPRNLPRHPAIVTSEHLASLDERLRGIPIRFLHKRLREMSPLLQQGLTAIGNGVRRPSSASPPSSPPSSIPPKITVKNGNARSVEVTLNHATGKLPTHAVAIIGSPSAGHIYPIHGLLYAAHCALFPLPPGSLSASDPEPQRSPTNHRLTLSLPLISLKLPHPDSFSAINTFFYTENPAGLLRVLLPVPHSILDKFPANKDPDTTSLRPALSTQIAATFNPPFY
ncbi:uncharacterized protein EI90DRAFT_3121479 [Cantharellus anzutake]|uniref:uncharacterized protein n=1 Tax=Cantharellus anzutake TaxID=1750568 RepID=UPI00190774C6|nr:uncharacterized protein EI90DRAFT_3121479 [Cantharellus anzutake]KAF8334140.1 hypothetical protein EI90DRAFT_3121479 [Cantharellus anzutake]